MKSASAEVAILTVFSIVLVSLSFIALKEMRITGMAFFEDNESGYGTEADTCGREIPCGCGDTVTSSWTMNSNLTCSGTALIAGDDDIVIDCNSSPIIGDQTGYGIYINNFDNITVVNCTITNFTTGIYAELSADNTLKYNNVSNNTNNGVYLKDSSGNNISYNNASYNSLYGIYLEDSSDNNILDNTADNNSGSGIYLRENSNNNNITNNTANGNNDYGIYLYNSSDNNKVLDNTAKDNAYGIYLNSSSNNNTISNNNAKDNQRGIYLKNSLDNDILDNNASPNTYYGIYLYNSSDNNVTGNNVSDNTYSGIYLNDSTDNVIFGNNASDNNVYHGIELYNSSNNAITDNTANNNSKSGIYLWLGSNNNTISYNTANNNSDHGIYLYNSSDNNILGNDANNNTQYGIYLEDSSDNNTISYNTVSNNSDYGIYLDYGLNNSITDNAAKNNSRGIYLVFCSNNTILNNTASNNSDYGILLSNSLNNNASYNNASDNDYGISLSANSNNNTISYNTVSNNTNHGIYLSSNSNNTISYNTAKNNSDYGIYLYYGLNNNVSYNNASDNDYGIYLEQSSNNTVLKNNLKDNNNKSGIYLERSSNNSITSNNASDNTEYGIYIDLSSTNNNITDNIANNNTVHGILVAWSSDNFILNNDANDNNNGIRISIGSHNNTVANNTANNNSYCGISLFTSDSNKPAVNNTILNNHASNNYNYGICLGISLNNTILNNTVNNNSDGIYLSISSNNDISNNNITSNDFRGVYLINSPNNSISNNILNNNNASGIWLNSSDNNNITSNRITDNPVGINISSGSDSNLIHDNYFNNTINLKDSSNINDNDFNTTYNCTEGPNILGKQCMGGNFWNDYKGKDIDNDWIGDTNVPYNYRDYLPLTYNSIAHMDILKLNSSYAANTTNENLTCWVNSSDIDADNVTYHGFWYVNGTEQIDQKWNKTKTNSGADIEAQGVADDSRNNIFVAGYYWNSSNNKTRIIYKYDSSGNDEANVTQPDSGEDSEWFDIIVDGIDDVIAAGYTTTVSSIPYISVAKYNNSLGLLKQVSIGNQSAISIAQSVAVDYDHNIVVAGYQNSSGNYDFVVIKFDKNLDELWNATFDLGGNNDYAMGVAVDSNNDIIVTGRTENSTTGDFDFITVKYYANGTYAWNKTLNMSESDRAYGVTVDSQDNIIVVGRIEPTNPDILIVKYNSSGNEEWNKTIAGSGDDSAEDVVIDSRGNIIIGAWTNSFGAGQRDFWIIKLNSSGNHTWNFTLGGTDNERFNGITADNYDDIIAAGSTKSFPASSSWNLLTVKYGGFETGEYTPGNVVDASTVNSSETSIGDKWSCEVIAYDGKQYGFYNMSNELFIISDTAPQWYNNKTSPPSPATYSPGQTYYFNVSWLNNIYVDTVFIEHDFNGTLLNYTVDGSIGDNYSYNWTDLAEGTYNWSMYANDTAGLWNHTDNWTYVVQKETPTCSLIFTPAGSTIYNTSVNVSCSCTGEVPAVLLRNVTDVTANNNQYRVIAAGDYFYNCTSAASENYTYAENVSTYNITKNYTLLNLTATPNWTVDYPTLTNVSCSASHDQAIVNLTRNGTPTTSIPDVQTLAAGSYNYSCSMPESQNYTANYTENVLTVNKNTSTCTLILNETYSITYGQQLEVYCSCTNPEAPTKLWRNETNVTATENNTPITLPVGAWEYVCNASETQNYTSASNTSYFNVTKANSSVNLLLDWADNNIIVDVNSTVNITGIRVTGEGNITIYENGTHLANGTSPLEILKQYTTLGDYNITVDYPGTQNYTSSSKTHILTIRDLTPPTWSNNKTSPPSPATYSPGQNYQFNVTWIDNVDVSNVTIEHDFNGTLWNYSVNTNISSEYYYDYSDLAAGTYNWKECANDTEGGSNCTDQWNYTVEKASSTCILNFTPASPQIYGTSINASCSCTGEVPVILYRDGDNVTAENNQYVVVPAGNHTYNCTSPASENYTSAETASTYNISKNYTALTLTATPGWSVDESTQTNVSCTASNNEVVVELFRNGANVSSPDIQTLSAGTYNYSCRANATQNYTGNATENILSVSRRITASARGKAGCVDECTYGEKTCGAGGLVYVCGEYDGDRCTEWKSFECAPDEKCENGECVPAPCIEDWMCGEWSPCEIGYQVRDCFDFSSCGTYEFIPLTSKECEVEEEEAPPAPPVEAPVYITPEYERELEEERVPEKVILGIIPAETAKAVGYSLVILAVISLVIATVVAIARRKSIYSVISAEIKKGLPESQIKRDIIKKGYSKEDAEKLLRKEEMKKLSEVISQHKAKGFEIDEIKGELISKGWKRELVEQAIVEVEES